MITARAACTSTQHPNSCFTLEADPTLHCKSYYLAGGSIDSKEITDFVLLQDKPAEKATKEIYESTEKVVADLKEKWDKTDEKPSVIALGVAGLVGIWVLNGVATALDSLPLFSGLFQLVGIFVTGWFTYRYLVFAPGEPSGAT